MDLNELKHGIKDKLFEERSALEAGLERAGAAAGAAEREHLRWVLACDRAELWRHDGCRNMAQWLSGKAQISNWKARRFIGAAYALEHLAGIAAALSSGSLSLDKTVELTRFATPDSEGELISWARRVSVTRVRERADEETSRPLEEVADACRNRYLEWRWYPEGNRLRFEGELPADQGVVLTDTLERLARDLPAEPRHNLPFEDIVGPNGEPTRAQRRADALVLLASSLPKTEAAPGRTEVVLHAPLESLSGEGGSATFGGQVLHQETARRLCCDARVQLVAHHGGKPVGIGRASQITPYWLRRQVFFRDGHQCTFPGCEARRFLTPHHIHHWARGGATDLDNLITVCSFHHTLLHEFGWSVSLVGGNPVWLRPSGRRYEPGPAPPRKQLTEPEIPRYLWAEAATYWPLIDYMRVT